MRLVLLSFLLMFSLFPSQNCSHEYSQTSLSIFMILEQMLETPLSLRVGIGVQICFDVLIELYA